MVYPHKWSPISYKSSAGQRKHIGQRPVLYRWTTQPTERRGSTPNVVVVVDPAGLRRPCRRCQASRAVRGYWTLTRRGQCGVGVGRATVRSGNWPRYVWPDETGTTRVARGNGSRYKYLEFSVHGCVSQSIAHALIRPRIDSRHYTL